jgi:hypothetical protein
MAENEINPEPSTRLVLVMDNGVYHNAQLNLAPTSSSQKSARIDWLSENGISFSEGICKPKLYSLIKMCKPRFRTFRIYALLVKHAYSVHGLLPYHPDLNLIELIQG